MVDLLLCVLCAGAARIFSWMTDFLLKVMVCAQYQHHKIHLMLSFLPNNNGFLCSLFLRRYRETDAKASNWNWIELPVVPSDARKVKIHNLTPRTKYEFQVIGMNEFGDGMYSEIIEAQTKGKYRIEVSKTEVLDRFRDSQFTLIMLFHLSPGFTFS